MSEESMSALTGFARVVLPNLLLSAPDSEISMLLSGRVGQAYVQRAWRELCEHTGQPAGPAVDSISTTTRWLAGQIAALVITLPPPRTTGDAHLALCIVPAGSQDGPRRYFTLEAANSDSSSALATALIEWTKTPTAPSGFGGVRRGTGVEPTIDSLAAAVEGILGGPKPDGRDVVNTETTVHNPWWKFWKS